MTSLVDASGFETECVECGMFPSQGCECNKSSQVLSFYQLWSKDTDLEPIWGDDNVNLWPEGEPLYIAAGTGVGKTTLALQLIAARGGLDNEFLGFPVKRTESKILYVAADRPNQFARLAKTMFTENEASVLDEDIAVCWGFPAGQKQLNEDTDLLVKLAFTHGPVDTIVLDSAKDFSAAVTSEEGGSAFNEACRKAVQEGVNVVVLHHERKMTTEGAGKTPHIDNIYGSQLLTAGAGSVLALKKADEQVVVHQIKSAAGELPPLKIEVDETTRRMSAVRPKYADGVRHIGETGKDLTVSNLARFMGCSKPAAKEWLNRQVNDGKLRRTGKIGRETIYDVVAA